MWTQYGEINSKQPTSTYWYPHNDVFPPPLDYYCFFSFCLIISFGQSWGFSWMGYFSFASFEWHVDAHCRSHGVQILMSKYWRNCFFHLSLPSLFYLPFFLSFILRQNWRSYSMSGTMVERCLNWIRTLYWRVKDYDPSVSAVWRSIHWARLIVTVNWNWWYCAILSICFVWY